MKSVIGDPTISIYLVDSLTNLFNHVRWHPLGSATHLEQAYDSRSGVNSAQVNTSKIGPDKDISREEGGHSQLAPRPSRNLGPVDVDIQVSAQRCYCMWFFE